MARSWITPKTNWQKTDTFAYSDYNRIRNNLLYINDMLNERYPEKAQTLDLGEALSYSAEYLPSWFNAFEDALESFTRVGANVNIGSKKTFSGNSAFIGYQELNRLENCCLKWYNFDPVIHVESISISPKTQTIKVGETKTFTVTCTPVDAEDASNWVVRSSNTSILTVTKSGMSVIATAVGVGNATISVSVYNSSDTASITVEDVLVTQIVPESNSVTIPNGGEINFGYTLLPANATNKNALTITSSRSDIVSAKGAGEGNVLLKGKLQGQSVITFKCGQAIATVNASVLNTAKSIWVSATRGGTKLNKSTVAGIGRTLTDYIVTDPTNAIDKDEFTYTVSNPQCISVAIDGDVLSYTTLAVGTSVITVTLDSGTGSWNFTVEVR